MSKSREMPKLDDSQKSILEKARQDSKAGSKRPQTAIGGLTQRTVSAISTKMDVLEQENKQLKETYKHGLLISIPTNKVHASDLANRDIDSLEGDDDFNDLVESIKSSGQTVPALVRPHPDINGDYLIVYGHRRWAACQLLNIEYLAINKEMDDAEAAYIMSIENGLRSDIPVYGLYVFWGKWFDRGFISTKKELVAKSGYKKSYVYMVMEIKKIENLLKFIKDKESITLRQWKAAIEFTKEKGLEIIEERLEEEKPLSISSLMSIFDKKEKKEIQRFNNPNFKGFISEHELKISFSNKELEKEVLGILLKSTT